MRRLALTGGGVVAALLIATLAYTQLRERRITQVVVTPESISLAVGGTQRFRVYGVLSTRDTVEMKATYRATGGVITPVGLYTAGAVPGNYQVIAVLHDDDYEPFTFAWDDGTEGADDDEEGAMFGTATVTVTGAL